MQTPYPILYELQKLTVDLSLINRQHLIPGTDRRENDVEHSLTVAMLCWYIHDKNNVDLDIAKILKYALTHDFVERYAGDVPSFAPQAERDAKVIREKESLDRLSEEFSDFGDMVTTMQKYEIKEDEESLFVWSVDKIQQLVMGDATQKSPLLATRDSLANTPIYLKNPHYIPVKYLMALSSIALQRTLTGPLKAFFFGGTSQE